uniref:hypothetical protein n=1 Tax=Flavobacterium sp. TaxID=239 RepID=UPI00404B8EDD
MSSTTQQNTDSISDDSYEINAEITTTKNYDLLIPDGYLLLDKTEGDINNDGILDMVLALKSQQEKDEELLGDDAPVRMLRLLLKDAKGNYSIAAESTTVLLQKNMGGAGFEDPFQSVEIEPGKFKITHMGGAADRWNYVHTYTYNKVANAWFLTEIEEGLYDGNDSSKDTKKIETTKEFGKINFIDFKGF